MDEENKVSINAATAEELKSLDGIGKARAEAIVDYRKEHGKFKSIEDVKNVKGIGDATFKKIEDRITLYSKSELFGKKIAKKVETSKHVIAHKTKEEVSKLKEVIALLPTNIKKSVIAGEVKALEAAKAVKNATVHTIDKAILKGKTIKGKIATKIGLIATKTKDMLNLLKQELSMEKNTLRFKQFMSTIKETGLKAQNTVLKGANKVKEGAENIKYKLEDKYLLAKDRITTKVQRTKNVIARKTGMQIALLKEDIKKKFANMKQGIKDKVDKVKETFSVDSEKLAANRERIEQLKAERDKLLNELFPKEETAHAPVR